MEAANKERIAVGVRVKVSITGEHAIEQAVIATVVKHYPNKRLKVRTMLGLEYLVCETDCAVL